MDILPTSPDASTTTPLKQLPHHSFSSSSRIKTPKPTTLNARRPLHLQPQSLTVTFPSSHRPTNPPSSPATYEPFPTPDYDPIGITPSNPAQKNNNSNNNHHHNQDSLQTALTHLSRAAAHLRLLHLPSRSSSNRNPLASHAGRDLEQALYRFAAPSWSAETWDAAVAGHVARLLAAEEEVDVDAVQGSPVAIARAGGKVFIDDDDKDGPQPFVAAARLVGLAMAVLMKKGGEDEGVYWRDGLALGEMWESAIGEIGGL